MKVYNVAEHTITAVELDDNLNSDGYTVDNDGRVANVGVSAFISFDYAKRFLVQQTREEFYAIQRLLNEVEDLTEEVI